MSILIVSVVFIGGGLLAFHRVINDQRRGEASVNWPRVPAVIDATKIAEYANRSRRPMNIVAYRYTYQGRAYESTRVSFRTSSSRKERTEKHLRYKDAGEILVFVNPDDPSIAVIEPGRPPIHFTLIAFGILGISTGVVATRVLFRGATESRKHEKVATRTAGKRRKSRKRR
jgi:hypothetical protein